MSINAVSHKLDSDSMVSLPSIYVPSISSTLGESIRVSQLGGLVFAAWLTDARARCLGTIEHARKLSKAAMKFL
jgi:hypothetical protein